MRDRPLARHGAAVCCAPPLVLAGLPLMLLVLLVLLLLLLPLRASARGRLGWWQRGRQEGRERHAAKAPHALSPTSFSLMSHSLEPLASSDTSSDTWFSNAPVLLDQLQ